ncbi:hypothetical protein ABZW96_33040 [Nocardia sp. NPDC004168]|uniref:hypothetical protein n=1 Tax=Nocardia sp. NPDC004168 TaxID=3154452 RepID=UPI00339F3AF6
MSRVDDVVAKISDDMDFWLTGGVGFRGDEVQSALNLLSGLNSTEFKEAFDRLLIKQGSVKQWDLRRQLAQDAGDLKNDPKYAEILRALESGDPTWFVKAKKAAEDQDDNPTHGFEKTTDEIKKKHAYYVDIYEPKYASEALKELIESVEFTMQCQLDTLGCGKPNAAPDFTDLLDGTQVATADGWSQLRTEHKSLKESLEKEQAEYLRIHQDITGATFDSAVTNSALFKKLTDIIKELNENLMHGRPKTLYLDGDKLSESSGGPPNCEVYILYSEQNKDRSSDDFGKFVLTPEAEQRYYVKLIDAAVEKWEKEYVQAVKTFRELAEKIDKAKHRKVNNDNRSNTDNSGGGQGGYPYPIQGAVTQPTGYQNEDFSSTYDDLLGGSASTSDTFPGAALDGNVGDSLSSLGSASPLFPATLQGGAGTGSGMPSVSAGPAAGGGDNGASALSQMAMMSALSGMMNQGNRQPSDDRANETAHADQDRREKRERQQNYDAPAATANSAAQTTPPGVTAPTDPSTPPPVTRPGVMNPIQIGDSLVQVSQPAVAEALRQQAQNTAMNAEAAYAGTAGESIPERHPWASVEDVATLRTGDVVQWEKHSALIVKNENGLNVLDNGLLVHWDSNNPPLTEKYGHFTGYRHPTGLDVDPGTAGPEAAAPPPSTVSAAPPASPPPVGPQQV